MKDGRFENADELRVWLDRPPPPPKQASEPQPRTEVVYDGGTWFARCSPCLLLMSSATKEGAQFIAAHHDTHRHGHQPDCPKCHGAGHYVVECPTPGWRMVDCECAK